MEAPVEHPASLYDGLSARRHDVAARLDDDALAILGESGEEAVPLADLVPLDTADPPRFGHRHRPGWRLTLHGEVPPEWHAALPVAARYGRWIDRVGLVRAAAACLIVSTAAVAIGVTAPDWLAPLVPESVEARIGDVLLGDFQQGRCASAEGQRALATLTRRLAPDDKPMRIEVTDWRIVNAVTLPGRRILLFKGLIDEAKSPDEVAGVLAHEMGHVVHRDAMRGMLRELGLGVVLSAFGGNAGGNAEALLALRYGRAAERKADAESMRRLRAAQISPLPMVGFFDRLGRMEMMFGRFGTAMSYISSHPLSAERRRAFAASAVPGARYRPALDQPQWVALRRICGDDTAR